MEKHASTRVMPLIRVLNETAKN